MHYSRHHLTASVTIRLRSDKRQPMTNGLTLLAYWSVCQKLNHVCTYLRSNKMKSPNVLYKEITKLSGHAV